MSEFKKYYLSLSSDERERLAAEGKTSVAYLRQIAYGHRKAGAGLMYQFMEAGRHDLIGMFNKVRSEQSESKAA